MSGSDDSPRRRTVLVLIAAGVAVAIVVAGVLLFVLGDSGNPEGILFEDDFSEVAEHWNVDDGGSRAIEDGVYRISLDDEVTSALDSVVFEDGREYAGVSVSAEVAFQRASDGGYAGLTCGHALGDGESITGLFGRYEGEIGVDGTARIVRSLNDDETTLGESESPVRTREGDAATLTLRCSYSGDVSTVSLDLDGETIVSARDRDPFESFESSGMYARAESPGLEVTFDDLRAEEIRR